jgi:hypothetical protein
MVDISVQLFSNFNLTLQMMKEEKLLETLFRTMSILCAHALTARDVQNQSALVLDMRHVIISQRMYWPITNDLVNILTHKMASQYFLQRDDLTLCWLEMVEHIQGMNCMVRAVTHVQHDAQHWASAFFLELELLIEALVLITSRFRGTKSGTLPMVVIDPSDWDSDLDATLNCMHQKLDICTIVLRRWLASDTHGLTLPTKASSVARFGCHVASQPISFNIPLHRFYAFFASEVLRLTEQTDGDVKQRLRQRTDEWIWQLVEHPLRLQVAAPIPHTSSRTNSPVCSVPMRDRLHHVMDRC